LHISEETRGDENRGRIDQACSEQRSMYVRSTLDQEPDDAAFGERKQGRTRVEACTSACFGHGDQRDAQGAELGSALNGCAVRVQDKRWNFVRCAYEFG
jgi:hypothetical protein